LDARRASIDTDRLETDREREVIIEVVVERIRSVRP
jgi:hypothetical protein